MKFSDRLFFIAETTTVLVVTAPKTSIASTQTTGTTGEDLFGL